MNHPNSRRGLLILTTLLLCPAATLHAGYEQPCFIDACRSSNGRFLISAEPVGNITNHGPNQWHFVWKDTRTQVTKTFPARGVSLGQVHGQLFIAPDGETFALFNHVTLWYAGKSDMHGAKKLWSDKAGYPKDIRHEAFSRRIILYKKDGSVLKELGICDLLNQAELNSVMTVFSRVNWLENYPGLNYRKTARPAYALCQVSPDYTVLEFHAVAVRGSQDRSGRVVRVSLTDGCVLPSDMKLAKDQTPICPFVGPNHLPDDTAKTRESFIPGLDPVRMPGTFKELAPAAPRDLKPVGDQSKKSDALPLPDVKIPPGWLPVQRLDEKPIWTEVRKIEDKIHLYLPPGVTNVRGIFVCYVFHSQDPRELARLWKFALVTVPWPFEYDLGHNDKRNGRYKLGHPVGNMGILLDYLNVAAKETKHPELEIAPIVGWLGQNGSHLGNDLFKRAPDRMIGWTDSFPNTLAKYPEFTAKVPFAYAWEFTPQEAKERQTEREKKLPGVKDQPTPAPDLACRANTYGFPHGIYSKWTFFMLWLDRLIRLRLPELPPPPGEPTKLRPVEREKGWVGDYNAVSEWNPIAPFAEAKGMVTPMWLPDAYCAWGWRAYHTAKPDIKLTAPVVEYRGKGARKDCGLGFGNVMKPNTLLTFAAETTGKYAKIEFYSGDKLLGVSEKAPFHLEGVRLERGLHALFAVGISADSKRKASRAAFLVVE